MKTELSRSICPDTEACFFRSCGIRKVLFLILLCVVAMPLVADPDPNPVTISNYGIIRASFTPVEITPSFVIQGSLDPNFASGVATGTEDSSVGNVHIIESSGDISVDDLVVYLRIRQKGNAHCSCNLTISVEATELMLELPDGTLDTETHTNGLSFFTNENWPWLGDPINMQMYESDITNDFVPSGPSVSGTTASFSVHYTSYRIPEMNNGELVWVGGLAYKWLHDSGLPGGTYIASITMRIQEGAQ